MPRHYYREAAQRGGSSILTHTAANHSYEIQCKALHFHCPLNIPRPYSCFHLAIKLRVQRAIHLAHAALPELAGDFVVGNGGVDHIEIIRKNASTFQDKPKETNGYESGSVGK